MLILNQALEKQQTDNIVELQATYDKLLLDYQDLETTYNQKLANLEAGFKDQENQLQMNFTAKLGEAEQQIFILQTEKANMEASIKNTLDQLANDQTKVIQDKEDIKNEFNLLNEKRQILEDREVEVRERENRLINLQVENERALGQILAERTALQNDQASFGRTVQNIESDLNNRTAELVKREEQLVLEEGSLNRREIINRELSQKVTALQTQVMDKRYAFEQTYKEVGWKQPKKTK